MRRVTVIFATLTFLNAFSAQASEARSAALLYNLAFEDQTDIFMFPHLLPAYEGLYFYLPKELSKIYGGLIYNVGPDSSVGVFIHRHFNNAFDQFQTANPSQQHLAGQIFDLMYGTGDWGAALRLHVWSEVSTQQPPLADPAESNTAVSTELAVSFNLSDGLNVLGSLGVRNVKDTFTTLLFKAGGRYLSPEKNRLRPVFAGQIRAGLYIPDEGGSSFGFMLPVLGGVRFAAIKDILCLGLMGGLEVQLYVPDDGDNQFAVMAPILQASVEWQALKWLQLRAGLKGGYGVHWAGAAKDNMPKHEQMSFSSGVGIPLGPFSLDAVLEYSLWNNGPYLVGGSRGLFAGVSLSYTWGGQSAAYRTPAQAAPVAESAAAIR